MYTEFEATLRAAEDHYLQPQEKEFFLQQLAALDLGLATYEKLQEQEEEIFQGIANCLQEVIPLDQTQALEQALLRWMSVLRYAAMAMLLNSSVYLERQLLAWLANTAQIDPSQSWDQQVSDGLLRALSKLLTQEQQSLLHPFCSRLKPD
ncbi:MAG: phycobilisome protein [Acaryochloridaceae cyanobacterium SU_2_1]|nr:phycobilisome protein [Acaryochloridaceae cyanobacterium SU_2_1]NJM95032.1 phycobilisome protein [Acaryochloridaceae cyanobacterium CSU_5_19]